MLMSPHFLYARLNTAINAYSVEFTATWTRTDYAVVIFANYEVIVRVRIETFPLNIIQRNLTCTINRL